MPRLDLRERISLGIDRMFRNDPEKAEALKKRLSRARKRVAGKVPAVLRGKRDGIEMHIHIDPKTLLRID